MRFSASSYSVPLSSKDFFLKIKR